MYSCFLDRVSPVRGQTLGREEVLDGGGCDVNLAVDVMWVVMKMVGIGYDVGGCKY